MKWSWLGVVALTACSNGVSTEVTVAPTVGPLVTAAAGARGAGPPERRPFTPDSESPMDPFPVEPPPVAPAPPVASEAPVSSAAPAASGLLLPPPKPPRSQPPPTSL
ncbi:MAG: hypothetical protein FJ096_15440 [Deltaproteobacteria bacterium]|nr:hypothetical protein [Deltaproteobacteria bacterium]